MEPWQLDNKKKEVASVVFGFFEAGKNKDLAVLNKFHSPSSVFTKFDEHPPYTRQDSEEAFVYEQASFANLSDYRYEIENLRIDLIGETAVATFYLNYKGMFVNDYSFEGRTLAAKSRVTMVLAKFQGEWKIAHSHFSSIPERPAQK